MGNTPNIVNAESQVFTKSLETAKGLLKETLPEESLVRNIGSLTIRARIFQEIDMLERVDLAIGEFEPDARHRSMLPNFQILAVRHEHSSAINPEIIRGQQASFYTSLKKKGATGGKFERHITDPEIPIKEFLQTSFESYFSFFHETVSRQPLHDQRTTSLIGRIISSAVSHIDESKPAQKAHKILPSTMSNV